MMARPEDAGRPHCPVCGTALPTDNALRRCPRCGARILWTPSAPPLGAGVLLFNARLCGIMAGMQIGMIALLVAGYRLPLPWGVAMIVIALPITGYVLAGEMARRTPAHLRLSALVLVVASNAGLLVALTAAILGLLEPVTLAIIAGLVGALTAPCIRKAIKDGC